MKHIILDWVARQRGLLILVFAVLVSGCGAGGSSTSSSVWYAHWNCNGQSQCIADMGTNTGTAGPFASQSDCDTWRNTYFFGAVCDQSLTGSGGGGSTAPTISSFSPINAASGGTVVITGTNFPTNIAQITVTIDGVTATVVSATSTQISITIRSEERRVG